MGSLAPVRVESASAGATAPPPYHLVPNQYSLIDKSDLVFIDAVGTAFSTPVGKAKGKDFWGVDQDLNAFAKAITRYVTINQRWNSPKFLFGESYGTTRSAGLVNKLQRQGMAFNGVVLLSSILNYASNSPGLDQNYIGSLPTFAAIAWYHDKVPNKPASMDAFVNEARAFATGEYASALAKGQALTPAEEDAIATKLSRFTGLSPQYLKEANFRVSQGRFRKELLRDERRTVGRYDARYEGIDLDAAGENPEYDASDTAIAGAFVAAFNNYVEGTLKWQSDVPYKPTSFDIIREWDWKHEQPGSRFPQRQPYVAGDLARAMRENPKLHVLSANGYFDLATPFFATEFDLEPHAARSVAAREPRVHVLPVGAHGVPQRRCACEVQGGSLGVLRSGAVGLSPRRGDSRLVSVVRSAAEAAWSVTCRRPPARRIPDPGGSPITSAEVARRETVRTPSNRASPSRPGGSIACPRGKTRTGLEPAPDRAGADSCNFLQVDRPHCVTRRERPVGPLLRAVRGHPRHADPSASGTRH